MINRNSPPRIAVVGSAVTDLTTFVDALSNWYVRRSRDRFWRAGWEPSKVAAHETLYDVLVTTAKLIAPRSSVPGRRRPRPMCSSIMSWRGSRTGCGARTWSPMSGATLPI